jgi:hypothetical protein
MSDVIYSEPFRGRPDDIEIRIKPASWDKNEVAVKFTWFTSAGQPARGGEVPIEALPQMLEVAIREGGLKLR